MVGVNKPNEMGTLFCALAGLMNLGVILDAMYYAPHASMPEADRRKNQASPAHQPTKPNAAT
jgi:hypothetical protein